MSIEMDEIKAVTAAHTARPAGKPLGDAVDRQRVARFRSGDESAFDELVQAHQQRVARLVHRLLGCMNDVDDVVQEVFVAVLTHLPRFRGEAKFSTWLTAIAVNLCRSRRRRWGVWRRHWQRLTERQQQFDDEESQTKRVEPDAHQAVRAAVRRLAAKYREPVVLYYFEQMSTAEAAEALGLKVGTLEVRLSRARKKLKEILNAKL